ncbi:MAG: hypothetical protein ACR2P1_27235 [Pseudomonadales bacterium]
MKSITQNPRTHFDAVATIFVLAVAMLGLSACGHTPPKEVAVGDQFLGKRTVKVVYQDDHGKSRHRESTPINAGDEFEIVREPGTSNKFKFVPSKNFRGDPAWADLRLEYQAGIDTNEPVPLIAEICAQEQSSGQTDESAAKQAKQYDYINANVQNDFLNLSGRGLEFLEGGPIEFNGRPHTIHIFHILKIGADKVSLVIFYCDADNCNHKGMIDA